MILYQLKYRKVFKPATVDEFLRYGKGVRDSKLFSWRRVRFSIIDGLTIYTSFLGIDHRFGNEGEPLVFETMIQDKKADDWLPYQTRCATWRQALKMHLDAKKYVKQL